MNRIKSKGWDPSHPWQGRGGGEGFRGKGWGELADQDGIHHLLNIKPFILIIVIKNTISGAGTGTGPHFKAEGIPFKAFRPQQRERRRSRGGKDDLEERSQEGQPCSQDETKMKIYSILANVIIRVGKADEWCTQDCPPQDCPILTFTN